jgi:hypothetical protein
MIICTNENRYHDDTGMKEGDRIQRAGTCPDGSRLLYGGLMCVRF